MTPSPTPLATRPLSLQTSLPLLLLAALMLAGCGTHRNQQRQVAMGPGSEWRPAPERHDQPLQLTQPRLEGTALLHTVMQPTIEREWAFDLVRTEGRMTRDPDAIAIGLGAATLGLGCAINVDGCFGKWGEWTEYRRDKTNPRTTGRERRSTPAKFTDSFNAELRVTGVGADGKRSGPARMDLRGRDGTLSAPIVFLAERLPERPLRLEVTLAVQGPLAAPEPTLFTLDGEQVNSLQLNAEAWMPAAERQRVYLAQIRPRVLAGEHAAASELYARVEALNLPRPDDFQLRYAESQWRAGKKEQARERLQRFLEKAGPDSPHAAEARRLLEQT